MKYISNIFKGSAAFVMATMLVSCGDSFLDQDPLSFYEPSTTYSNEAGLKSALAMCDQELKTIIMDGNGNVIPMASNYIMSDIACMPRLIWVVVSKITLMQN